MQNDFLYSVEELMKNKHYDFLNLHKEASKMAKEGFKENNYNMTNTELLYFHEVEILMTMAGMKKLHDKVKWLGLENLALLGCIIILSLAFIFK